MNRTLGTVGARSTRQRGSALIIALVMITVVGLIVAAALEFAGVGLRASNQAIRPDREKLLAADAALDAAIQKLRQDPSLGQEGNEDCDALLPAELTAKFDVTIECTANAGSWELTTAAPNEAEFPTESILTLGRRAPAVGNDDSAWAWSGCYFNWNVTFWFGCPGSFSGGPEPGVLFQPSAIAMTDPLVFAGDVFSNSTIMLNGWASVNNKGGDFVARGSCSGGLNVSDGGVLECNIGYGADGRGADPRYPHRGQTAAFPTLRAVPATCDAKTYQVFEPGFYNDAVALNALFRHASCVDKDFWFKPGLYYFDFRNAGASPDCPVDGDNSGQRHQWCIYGNGLASQRQRIMGGTPKNWSPDGTPTATELTNPPNAGVAGSPAAEWVGLPANAKTIDGITATTAWAPVSRNPSGASGSPSTAWAGLPGNATSIDGSSATTSWEGSGRSDTRTPSAVSGDFGGDAATYAIGGGVGSKAMAWWLQEGEQRMNGFSGASVPAHATIDSVTIRVRHGLSDTARFNNPELWVWDGTSRDWLNNPVPCGGFNWRQISKYGSSLGTDSYDLTGCLNTAAKIQAAQARFWVMHNCSFCGTHTAYLDGIEIDVTYTDTTTRTVTLSGFSGGTLPSDIATVNSATATVVSSASAGTRQLTVTPGGGGSCGPYNVTTGSQVIDLAGCLNTKAKIDGASMSFAAAPSNSAGSATLDGVRLDVAYTPGDRSVIVSQFTGSPSTVPADAVTINSVDLDGVVTANGSTGTVTLYPGGGGAACGTWTLPFGTAGDLAGCLNTPTKVNSAYLVFGVSPTSTTGNAALDGFRLRVDYQAAPGRFSFPGMCDNDEPGVQFVFGGDSHLYVPNGSFELCAGPAPRGSGTRQQIAVYGIPPISPVVPSAHADPADQWSNEARAYAVAESPTPLNATTTFPALPAKVWWEFVPHEPRSLVLSGFGADVDIPAGAKVKKVTARVSHLDSGGIPLLPPFDHPMLKVWNGEGTQCAETAGDGRVLDTHSGGGGADPRYETVDLTNCFADADRNIAMNRLNGNQLTVEYVARPNYGCLLGICWLDEQTNRLDGVELIVELESENATSQVYIPQNGCVAGIDSLPNYYDGYADPDCAFMKWDGIGLFNHPTGAVSIQGTVYAPGGAIDVDDEGYGEAGVDYLIFGRGVIARHVRFKAFKLKAGYTDPVVGCGACGGTINQPADVTLTATIDGLTVIRANVVVYNPLLTDNPPDVVSWEVYPQS